MKRIFYLYMILIVQVSFPMQRIITFFGECKNYIKQKNEIQKKEWIQGYISHTKQMYTSLQQIQNYRE